MDGTITLTEQWCMIDRKTGESFWGDQTVVAVLNPDVLEQEIKTLVDELPEGIVARVRIVTPEKVYFRWRLDYLTR